MTDISHHRSPAATRIAIAALLAAVLAIVVLVVAALSADAQDDALAQSRTLPGHTAEGQLVEVVVTVTGSDVRSFGPDAAGTGFVLEVDGNAPFDASTVGSITVQDDASLALFDGAQEVAVSVVTLSDSTAGTAGGATSVIQVETPFGIGVSAEHGIARLNASLTAGSGDEAPVAAGSDVEWTIGVENSGTVDLENVAVTVEGDEVCVVETLPAGFIDSCSTSEVAEQDTTRTVLAQASVREITIVGEATGSYTIAAASDGDEADDEVLGAVVTPEPEGDDAAAQDAEADAAPSELALTGDSGNAAATVALIASAVGVIALSAGEAIRRRNALLEA